MMNRKIYLLLFLIAFPLVSFAEEDLSPPNPNGCDDNKKVFKDIQTASGFYMAIGVLSSNSCGQRVYAETKSKGFFETLLVPSMGYSVKIGDYPQNCPSFIYAILVTMENEEKEKKHSASLCQKAKALVEVTSERVGF